MSRLPQVKYQDKDVIVREGAEANAFYIILKGEVQCSIVLFLCALHQPVHKYKCTRDVFLPVWCVWPSGLGDQERERASEADS